MRGVLSDFDLLFLFFSSVHNLCQSVVEVKMFSSGNHGELD